MPRAKSRPRGVASILGFVKRPRYVAATTLGIVAFLMLGDLPLPHRFLYAYDLGVLFWLLLILVLILRSDHAGMQQRADAEEAGAVLILTVSTIAATASLVAIGAELPALKDEKGLLVATSLATVIATILLSWLFLHTSFALHYAHEYYRGAEDRRGLEFPGETQPDYWDFLYFAFNLGAAAQTSDVAISARTTRRVVLAQTVLSFLFNTTILALAINVGASLL